MSLQRKLNWSSALRGIHADRLAVSTGFVVARNRITAFAGFRKTPLAVAGKFNRSAIMALAADADRDHQAKHGGTWAEAMSVCLKSAWQAARIARIARSALAH